MSFEKAMIKTSLDDIQKVAEGQKSLKQSKETGNDNGLSTLIFPADSTTESKKSE